MTTPTGPTAPTGPTRRPLAKAKVATTMHEFGAGRLHSGSDTGPTVTNPKQAVAIALSQARKATHNGGAAFAGPTRRTIAT